MYKTLPKNVISFFPHFPHFEIFAHVRFSQMLYYTCPWVILVNMVISVILGHEKTKIRNRIDYGKIDVFSVRTSE